ncbi:MAG TPA: ArsA family ATPase [Phycisphaerae bacterium]|nr:ArsA family ATPase [Phycisphaerae bacterium]
MRIILFTGKGGVGKSTIAVATALRTAAHGRRTLLVSSDVAHNLSDITAVSIGDSCVPIAKNLHALEVNILGEIRRNWAPIQQYIAEISTYLGMEEAVAEEVALIPGMDAVFLLTRILREVQSERFDTVIVDCAPTGGALQLLTLTDTAAGKINRLVTIERSIMKMIRPVTRRFAGMDPWVPDDPAYEAFERIIGNLGRLGEILQDPQQSSVRLVLTPDRIAVAETRRTYTYLGLFGFPVDAILVNRIFPDELARGYLGPWCALQREQMETISRCFLDTAILPIKYRETEPVGIADLRDLGHEIYGQAVADAMLSETYTVRFANDSGKPAVTFTLPGLDKSSLDVTRKSSELLIAAGGHSRVYALPDSLAASEILEARYDDGELTIVFETGDGR